MWLQRAVESTLHRTDWWHEQNSSCQLPALGSWSAKILKQSKHQVCHAMPGRPFGLGVGQGGRMFVFSYGFVALDALVRSLLASMGRCGELFPSVPSGLMCRTATKLNSFALDVCGRTALMRCDVMEAPAQALHSSAYGVCSCVCVCVCVCVCARARACESQASLRRAAESRSQMHQEDCLAAAVSRLRLTWQELLRYRPATTSAALQNIFAEASRLTLE